MDFQYGTPLKGFSDKGITKDWGIDKRGVADFSGLKLGTSGSELSEIKIYSTASIVPTAVPATACLDQTFALACNCGGSCVERDTAGHVGQHLD